MKKTIVLAGLVALSLGCWLANSPGSAETERSAAAASPFKGGVIVVGMKTPVPEPHFAVVLEKGATVCELGKRYFLVGTVVNDGNLDNWMDGQRVWVPIDGVETITEFSRIEEYKKAPDGPRGDKESGAPPASRL